MTARDVSRRTEDCWTIQVETNEMADADFESREIQQGFWLVRTDQSWCLTASTRSIVDGLLFGVVSLLLGAGFVFFLWL